MKRLSTQQKRILQRIRALHQDQQPLNISAVKRHYPRLLAQVMSLKHFRGWRKALEAAGLSYRTVHVELLDHCTCAICGEKLLTLYAPKKVLERIRMLHRKKPLNSTSFGRSESDEIRFGLWHTFFRAQIIAQGLRT